MDVPKDRLCHKSAARLIQIVLSLSLSFTSLSLESLNLLRVSPKH